MSNTIYNKEKNYYVYILIDPRDGYPFYIGKGTGNRYKRHLSETKENTSNRKKYNKIQKILSEGLKPLVVFHLTNVDEQTAYEEEEILTLKYGRSGIDQDGILTNIVLSSRPPSHLGVKRSLETRIIMSEKQLGNTKSKGNIGKIRSEETKIKMSISKKNKPSYKRTPEIIENYRIAQRKHRESTEMKFNLIHINGSIVTNISAKDFCTNYSNNKIINPSNFRRAMKNNKEYYGWTLLPN